MAHGTVPQSKGIHIVQFCNNGVKGTSGRFRNGCQWRTHIPKRQSPILNHWGMNNIHHIATHCQIFVASTIASDPHTSLIFLRRLKRWQHVLKGFYEDLILFYIIFFFAACCLSVICLAWSWIQKFRQNSLWRRDVYKNLTSVNVSHIIFNKVILTVPLFPIFYCFVIAKLSLLKKKKD